MVVVQEVRGQPVAVGATALLLAALVGLTWAATIVEAGAVPLGATIAAGLMAYGWRLRDDGAGRLLVWAFGLSLVLTAAYGGGRGGFPQPSEQGWL